MNIIARKTSEFLSLRRESALCAFAMLGLSHSFFYMVRIKRTLAGAEATGTSRTVPPWSTDTRSLQGGLTRPGSAQGGVELGGHDGTRSACGAHGSRSPEPLFRLDRQVGLRVLQVVMLLMWSLHQRASPARQGGATSGRAGRCIGWKGS
jgi:hypothetical protein